MKNIPWIKYLVYILLIFGLVYLDGYIGKQQAIYQKETFNLGITYHIISIIIKIFIGSILGLDYIIKEIKKEGTWKVSFPKIILMVIPSLYFSISYFIYRLNSILTYPIFIFIQNDFSFVYIFQLLLGYFLVTSFYKKSRVIKN